MGPGAVGTSEEAARAFLERLNGLTKTAAPQIYLRRPMEVRRELPKEMPPNCPSEEKEYTVGAINKLLEKNACEGEPQRKVVTVRTGREAYGHLPKPPEQDERHFDVPTVQGAISKLLERGGRLEKKAIDATEQIAGGMGGTGGGGPVGPFGPAGSTVDYVSRGLMGAGLGRTLGFMMRGRGIPEVIERRMGLGGAAIGLGLAGLAHRESTKAQARRTALMQALAKFDADRRALLQQSRDLKKAVSGQGVTPQP
jgi:hypothetical protein